MRTCPLCIGWASCEFTRRYDCPLPVQCENPARRRFRRLYAVAPSGFPIALSSVIRERRTYACLPGTLRSNRISSPVGCWPTETCSGWPRMSRRLSGTLIKRSKNRSKPAYIPLSEALGLRRVARLRRISETAGTELESATVRIDSRKRRRSNSTKSR